MTFIFKHPYFAYSFTQGIYFKGVWRGEEIKQNWDPLTAFFRLSFNPNTLQQMWRIINILG
jgi:hypothetical protein